MQKIKVKIDLQGVRENAKALKRWANRPLYAVVKANAYGHGSEEIVNALSGVADGFAVALIEEGLAIRLVGGGKEILVFTPPTEEEEVFLLAKNGFSATVDSLQTARLVAGFCNRKKLPINVHLKVNTGMNRYGFEAGETDGICTFLKKNPLITVKGIYTHLAECSLERAKKQLSLFTVAVEFCKRHFPFVIAHTGGTYSALLGEKYLFDAVRVGLGLYGYLPCKPSLIAGFSSATIGGKPLRKCMTAYAKTVSERIVFYGGAGYGKAFGEDERGGRLSVCRVGYADGFFRRRENGLDGWETHANELCMDACIRWNEGEKGAYTQILSDAEKVALSSGTISYEILCGATMRAEMIYDETVFCGNGRTGNEREEGRTARLGESPTSGSG